MGKHRKPDDYGLTSFAAGGRGDRVSSNPDAWTNGGDRSEDKPTTTRIPLQRGTVGSNDPNLRAKR